MPSSDKSDKEVASFPGWREILVRVLAALLGVAVAVVAQYPPYVEFMGLRWWEVWGQILGGVAMIFLSFMPKES